MAKPRLLIVPLVLVALLGGCAAPVGQGSNPLSDLEKVVDLVPWARSVADGATAAELTARITEISTSLPGLDIPEATKADIHDELTTLEAAVRADGISPASIAELRAIIDEIKSAIEG